MSKTKLRTAKLSINELIKHKSSHAYATQADMRHMLFRCIKDLHSFGYKIGHIKGLQPKHIDALVTHWKSQGKNPGTIKNYMSKLRYTASLLGKPELIKPNNADYAIEKRAYKSNTNKAIHQVDLSKCQDPYIRLSIEGQALFGFRREESMKFILSEAHQEKSLHIMPSWTKGGIGRTLTITHPSQREWLDKVAQLVKPGQSLIPPHRTYKEHLSQYKAQIKALKLSKLHGLRHAYAQRRYKELTILFDPKGQGLICPLDGGKNYHSMNETEKMIDQQARLMISQELGHSRISITKIYLG